MIKKVVLACLIMSCLRLQLLLFVKRLINVYNEDVSVVNRYTQYTLYAQLLLKVQAIAAEQCHRIR